MLYVIVGRVGQFCGQNPGWPVECIHLKCQRDVRLNFGRLLFTSAPEMGAAPYGEDEGVREE